MKLCRRVPSLLLLLLTALIALVPSEGLAQSYIPIDLELGLYCADLPNGTNMLVGIKSKKGLNTIIPLDEKAEIARVVKYRNNLRKRIRNLKQIRKSQDPFGNRVKLQQAFKFVSQELADGVENSKALEKVKANEPRKIFKKIGEMIQLLQRRLQEVEGVPEMIERCMRNEDLLPPPQPLSTSIIVFPFKHPDYGDTVYMRGIGVTAALHKKRYSGTLCVSASKANHDIKQFPKESTIYVERNPCTYFYQRTFRNFPRCEYQGGVAVGWIRINDTRFGSSPPSDLDLVNLQHRIDNYGTLYVRAPSKKRPCGTK